MRKDIDMTSCQKLKPMLVLGILFFFLYISLKSFGSEKNSESCEHSIKINAVHGDVGYLAASANVWRPVRLNSHLCEQEILKIADKGYVELLFPHHSILKIPQRSMVIFESEKEEKNLYDELINLFKRPFSTAFINASFDDSLLISSGATYETIGQYASIGAE